MASNEHAVTVLMAAYNSERFVREAVESVLNQTFENFELLIIDDGSSDNTVAICREYARRDSRVRLFPLPRNIGAPAALNFGLEHVRYDWVLRFDPDDVMMPRRIERQVAFIEEHPELSVASSLAILIDETGHEIGRSRSPYTTPEAVAATVAGPTLIGFHHPATAIRTEAIRAVGGYRGQYWPTDDLDLWARMSEAGYQMLVQKEYLIKYRHHAGSVSFGANRQQVLAMEWAQNSKARRRANLPELSYGEYLTTERKRSWLPKLNQNRRVTARTLYKAGLLHYAVGELYRAAVKIAVAGIFEPGLVVPRLWVRLWPAKTTTPTTSAKVRKSAASLNRKAA